MRYGILKDHKGNQHKFSKIILGGVPFGTVLSEEESFQVMDYYRAQGGNVIDTARVYCDWLENGHGASEMMVGRWLKDRGCREEFIIETKGGHPPLVNMEQSRMTKEDIVFDVEESLKALQIDYIDLFFLHRDDERVSVQVIVDILDELVTSGKIRMIGASNWRVERIIEANAYAMANGKTPFIASQIQWSYAKATAKETFNDPTVLCMDDQQYQLYLETHIPVLAYTALANGVFSSGYKSDLTDIAPKHKKYYNEENVRRYQELLKLCEDKDITPTKAALEYIIDNQLDSFAIVGCSKLEQLQDTLKTV